MRINAKHKTIVQAVTALYPDKAFELDGQELKWQTETPGELADPTENECAAIAEYIAEIVY